MKFHFMYIGFFCIPFDRYKNFFVFMFSEFLLWSWGHILNNCTLMFYVCLWYHSTFSFLLQRYFLKMSWHRAPLMVKYLCSHYSVCNNYQNTERSTFGALNVPASVHWPLLFHSSSAYHLVLTLLWRPPLVTIDPKDLCTRSPVN